MSRNRTASPYEIAFRHACSEITILDQGQNDLLQRLSHVRAWKQQKITQLIHLVHANAPITRLPTEILALIFGIVHQDAITVSHVDRHWRNLALRSPLLWRNLHLGLCNDQIREYLNRSLPLSIAITLDVVDKYFRDEDSRDEDLEESDEEDSRENPEAFMAHLTMLIHHVSRWHTLRLNCTSHKTMSTILSYLRGLSAPCLTHISIHLCNGDSFDRSLGWHVAIFDGSAPLLRTVHLGGITFANGFFPPAAIVELQMDARAIAMHLIRPNVFTYMPNLRVLDIRGPFLWSREDGDHPVSLPMLERLTWGCLTIKCLFESFVTPALRYLCLTPTRPDDEPDEEIQDFPSMITGLPILDELHYDIKANYAADCVFTGLPRVSVVQFPRYVSGGDCESCSNFLKALIEDPSRWPHLKTIVFKSLPDQLFDSLRDFVLARSSEEHRLTIRKPANHYCRASYYSNVASNSLSAEHTVWLQQHVNVEMEPCEYE